jgi:type IV secretory pathway VirB6-like protein
MLPPDSAFITTLNQLFTTLDGSLGKFTDDGRVLAGLLLAIVIAWDGIIGMLAGSGANEFLSKLIKHLTTAGFVAAMLSGVLVEPINQSFDALADKISGGKTSIGSAVGSIQQAAATIWSGKPAAGPTDGQTVSQGVVESWWNSLTGGRLTQMALEFIMSALIVIVILVAGAIFIAQFLISQILIKLALIIMPVMIPWMIFNKTEFLFDGWLRFFLSAGMQKVVGAFFFSITLAMLEGAATIAAASQSPAGALGTYALVLILCIVAAWLMLQIPQIAAGLISGYGGHGGGWLDRIPRPSRPAAGGPK